MAVLLLRLCGPLQSWGTASRFGLRDTALEPSKSGVIGLLCAALGTPREDDDTTGRLAALPMGVRVEREGRLETDFHTIGAGYGVARARGGRGGTVLSRRDYLADADFIVGLEGTRDVLKPLDQALQRPVWPLYLGRRSFVPGVPPRVAVVEGALEPVLRQWPWQPREGEPVPTEGLRLVLETSPAEGEARCDVPVSFAQARRRHRLRHVRTLWIPPAELRRPEASSTSPA